MVEPRLAQLLDVVKHRETDPFPRTMTVGDLMSDIAMEDREVELRRQVVRQRAKKSAPFKSKKLMRVAGRMGTGGGGIHSLYHLKAQWDLRRRFRLVNHGVDVLSHDSGYDSDSESGSSCSEDCRNELLDSAG